VFGRGFDRGPDVSAVFRMLPYKSNESMRLAISQRVAS